MRRIIEILIFVDIAEKKNELTNSEIIVILIEGQLILNVLIR